MSEAPDTFRYAGRRFLRFPMEDSDHRRLWCTVPARVAGRYHIQQLLAHGGGGAVMVGLDERTNREVLIKCVLGYRLERYAEAQDLTGAVEHIRRTRHHLQTERRILVQLRRRGAGAIPHPDNYVYDTNPILLEPIAVAGKPPWSLDDRALSDSEPFLILQRIGGTSLDALLKTRYRRGMPPRLALEIITQMVAVLRQLHRPFPIEGRTWELVYQDLKPGNIIISGNYRATLIDFGGCQLVIDGTPVLSGAHTPGYCAPEQVEHRLRSAAADVYGIGSTLYHMLTGIHPRKLLPKQHATDEKDEGQDTDRPRHRHGHVVRHWNWEPLDARCPDRLSQLVRRCLAADPIDRFPDASALADALAPLLEAA